jgi:hypothetical protein
MEFKVTPSDLESLAQGLSGLLGELAQAGDIRSVSAGAAENPQLASAIEEHLARWTQELQNLRESLASLTERLGGASSGYEQTEHSVLEGFLV